MVPGHPLKGGAVFSIGALSHPDIMRFNLKSAALFSPPNPEKTVTYVKPQLNHPTFGDAVQASFGSAALNITSP